VRNGSAQEALRYGGEALPCGMVGAYVVAAQEARAIASTALCEALVRPRGMDHPRAEVIALPPP